MNTHVKPSFCYIKVGCKGCSWHRHVCMMKIKALMRRRERGGNWVFWQGMSSSQGMQKVKCTEENRFSVCLVHKIGGNWNSFHMNLITESNTKFFFPSFLSIKPIMCIIYCFTRKIQVWYASPGLTSTLYHLSSQQKKKKKKRKDYEENYQNK